MFKAVTKNPRLLRDSIDVVSQLIDDGLFKLDKNGIELLAADRAVVSAVDFKLNASGFDEYQCDKETSIGLNLLNLLMILKRADADDRLTLSLDETGSRLDITLEGRSFRKFTIPLIEISAEDIPQIDKLDFAADVDVRADVIEQGIADADTIADSVIIELSDDMLRMFAQGNNSKAELKLNKENEALLSLNAKGKVKSRYSLDYLKRMIRASKIADKTKIRIGADSPLRMEFVGDHASLSMILAPRVIEE